MDYKRRKSLTRIVCCDTELSAKLQEALWQGDIDRLLFTSKPLQEKDRCIVSLYEDAGRPLVVKRHTWGGSWRTLRMAWREPSARRCARLGRYLSDHGIPTPRPRAWVEQRLGPLGFRSYLFTDFIEGTSLYRFIRSGRASADTLERLAKQVAGIWQQMVEIGVCHGDLKPENFIVDPDLRVWILDLERVLLGGRAKRHGERQLADLDVFLHIRGWHRQLEAREVFRRALARTEAGRQLGMRAHEQSRSAAAERAVEVDAALRVLILCDDAGQDGANAEQAVESVRDIADEVVVATCQGAGGQFECMKQLKLCDPDGGDCEWLLVLHQHERVTPVLAKRLQEAITRRTAPHAFRIAIERQYFGRNIAVPRAAAGAIRLFRPDSCSYAVSNCELTIAVDPERTGKLEGTIQQSVACGVSELVADLDQQSTWAAGLRWQDGERPCWIAALAHSIATFIKRCMSPVGIRSGWAGIHVTTLEAVFRWIEEVKLWQMSGQFHDSSDGICSDDVDLTLPLLDVRRKPKPPSEMPLNKAA